MFICQRVQRHPDNPRYARALWFRVVADPKTGKLRWQEDGAGEWRHPLRRRSRTNWDIICNLSGETRARRDFIPGYAELPRVTAGKAVTPTEAAKLLALPRTHLFAALELLAEHDGVSSPEAVLVPVREKPAPDKQSRFAAKLARAAAKVVEYDKKIKRLETIRKKWARREKYYSRKAGEPPAED